MMGSRHTVTVRDLARQVSSDRAIAVRYFSFVRRFGRRTSIAGRVRWRNRNRSKIIGRQRADLVVSPLIRVAHRRVERLVLGWVWFV